MRETSPPDLCQLLGAPRPIPAHRLRRRWRVLHEGTVVHLEHLGPVRAGVLLEEYRAKYPDHDVEWHNVEHRAIFKRLRKPFWRLAPSRLRRAWRVLWAGSIV